MTKDQIEKLIKYFSIVLDKKKIPFKSKKTKTGVIFSNPLNPIIHNNEITLSCSFIPGTDFIVSCVRYGKLGDIYSLVQKIDDNLKEASKDQIILYLNRNYNIVLGETSIENYLKAYEYFKFDLVPLVANTKACFEKDWPNKEHKDINEWRSWLDTGLNIGIKTGYRSNITVIDVDTQEIPECLKNVLTLTQKTKKGYHFIFKYDKDIPSSRIEDLKIDVLNDGKQFVAFPSIVDNFSRQWNFFKYNEQVIPEIPANVKQFLLDNITKRPKEISLEDKIKEDIIQEKIDDLGNLGEGNRNSGLTKIGGILRKQLNIEQTTYVMNLINRSFVKPSLSSFELRTIVNSLDKYSTFDDVDLAKKIYDYLKYAEEGMSRDIQLAIGESKERIDKSLAYLVKEQKIVKRGRMFHLIKKAEWTDTFPSIDQKINFKMPYFDDIAYFNWGDMILLGGKSKVGKTTLSMNIIKQLVDQQIKPYYICLESGSRFLKTAAKLGMKEGDFYWSIQTDPTKIEIENNSVTILDWLLIENKAVSDTVMQYFVNQLVRTNSVLIVFMQIRDNGEYFAKDMVKQFPAFAARYVYEDDNDGSRGSWHIDAIREAKRQVKKWNIPCQYDWETKTLKRVDELSDFRLKKLNETGEDIVL